MLAGGEKYLKYKWPEMPATVFLEYARNGNRTDYENIRNARMRALQALVFAECVENKGRFFDDITNGVWATCEESFWGVPAHLYIQQADLGLPDPGILSSIYSPHRRRRYWPPLCTCSIRPSIRFLL